MSELNDGLNSPRREARFSAADAISASFLMAPSAKSEEPRPMSGAPEPIEIKAVELLTRRGASRIHARFHCGYPDRDPGRPRDRGLPHRCWKNRCSVSSLDSAVGDVGSRR